MISHRLVGFLFGAAMLALVIYGVYVMSGV